MQRVVVPELRPSQYRFFETIDAHARDGAAWLDLGCGRELVPSWFRRDDLSRYHRMVGRFRTVVGIDYDDRSVRDNKLARKLRGDLAALPFASGTFDLATANMVVEHLPAPQTCLREVRRVLKPGGLFIFHTPNMSSPLIALQGVLPAAVKHWLIRRLETRPEQDVFPAMYRLNTASAVRKCANSCGFSVKETRTVCTAAVTAVLGPLSVFELLVIRALRARVLGRLRPNLIVVMEASAERS